MVTLFISDLHLHASRPHITKRFLMFLTEMACKAEALFILGDFFEAWIGDDNHDPHDETVIKALAQLSATGVPVYLMQGNRDFLIGEQFAHAANCKIIPDPSVIELYGTRILLMHGDSLCTLDVSHQRFRKIVRHPLTRSIFLSLPLVWRQKIATALRNKSQKKFAQPETIRKLSRNSEKEHNDYDRYNVTESAVKKALDDYQTLCLIHGHTHVAGIHDFKINNTVLKDQDQEILPPQMAKRIVLGEWGAMGNVLIFSKDFIELKNF